MPILNGDATPSFEDHSQFPSTNYFSNSTSSRDFTIWNGTASGDNLNISAITISGTNANEFSIGTSLPLSILPGNNETLQMQSD